MYSLCCATAVILSIRVLFLYSVLLAVSMLAHAFCSVMPAFCFAMLTSYPVKFAFCSAMFAFCLVLPAAYLLGDACACFIYCSLWPIYHLPTRMTRDLAGLAGIVTYVRCVGGQGASDLYTRPGWLVYTSVIDTNCSTSATPIATLRTRTFVASDGLCYCVSRDFAVVSVKLLVYSTYMVVRMEETLDCLIMPACGIQRLNTKGKIHMYARNKQ
ncbi:uncharacterized protein SCHCODRAFT_02056466 [Schizophyllum commune H4-8]|uniref:uncharacterized protein n=1 Tax=Schizophyllum commune (strain H4-8 / FGSC 9210) TaxID=578458 RepID=UPI00215E36E2|nr:uncharacterized protein SCHCODRAFT_02056466 [Schizophyllum commune H4-8]KAI5888516.1 hypothetical protein SCHCODRAFT_02056466 [Schizophyllum commune H4-8]